MKHHWIDYLMPFPRLDSPFPHLKILIISSNEHFREKNAQLMNFQVLCFLLGIKTRYKKNLFSLLDVKGF